MTTNRGNGRYAAQGDSWVIDAIRKLLGLPTMREQRCRVHSQFKELVAISLHIAEIKQVLAEAGLCSGDRFDHIEAQARDMADEFCRRD